MDLMVSLALTALGVVSLLLLWAEGLLRKTRHLAAAVFFICVAMGLRAVCMSHVTADYTQFLVVWVDRLRAGGGFSALGGNIGSNYNFPYLYFLAAISYSKEYSLYLIKLFSIAFDVLLAWSVMRITGLFSKSANRRMFAFLGTLLLPTVILNGAYWGQCDCIYAALAVLSLYLALKGRPWLAMVFAALSFSFKLQAIFFLPVFAVFLFTKRLKIRHLLAFPATYVVTLLPALLFGQPFWGALTLYYSQADSIGNSLNYSSPSLFAMLNIPGYEPLLSDIGISLALLFMVGVWAALYFRRKQVSNLVLLCTALLMVIGVPFFLPRMHDRYFFMADALSFALAVVLPKYLPVPVFCSFASLLGYYAYLQGRYLLPMYVGAIALILALVFCLVCLKGHLGRRNQRLSDAAASG